MMIRYVNTGEIERAVNAWLCLERWCVMKGGVLAIGIL